MTGERERRLDELGGRGDGIVRSRISITYPMWQAYGDRLNWLEDFSPHVSVHISRTRSGEGYREQTDVWGSRWRFPPFDLAAVCIENPLGEWEALESYDAPAPIDFVDWEAAARHVAEAHDEGRFVDQGTDHGFIFLRLTYLRGYENLMLDVAEGSLELGRLVSLVGAYWFQIVRRFVQMGVDQIHFGDDLGLQDRLPISPHAWRRFIKPAYARIFDYCRSHGVHVYLHSDGYIVDIIPELMECGVSVLNPQELVNGLDNLKRIAKGKVNIDLDIDRQSVTVTGTPEQVDAHIMNCIETLGSPHGGLRMVWGVYPPTPLANIEAVARAMDTYATYWVGRGDA